VFLTAKGTGLTKDSVANVSQLTALDKDILTQRAGRVRPADFDLVLRGINLLLGA
jgi:mRNA-degrading endonuclease toxin of MazEF toxin-antitoxin module